MDATKKPLRIPPAFGIYAEEHNVFDTFKRLLGQLIIEKPEDPIQFMIEWLKRDSDDVSKIAILGPPASGKSGISVELSKKINSVHIHQEALLDDELSDVAQKVKSYLSKDEAVPDPLWVELITERLKRKDCLRRGYILEGFPKNRHQGMGLQANGILLKHVVMLETPDAVLIERQAGKRIDPITGDVYHTTFDWPQDPTIQARLLEPAGISEKDMKVRLADYARHVASLQATYPSTYKMINADQPKADALAQTLTFVNSQFRSDAPHTPRIILIGPVGSGKSTMAAKLAEKYKLVDVPCGQIIREQIANETKLGEAVKDFVEKDQRVPNALVSKIVLDRLTMLDASTQGWVLHGFPLSQEQAESLADEGLRPNRVYFLDIPDDCIIERLCYRMTDPVSGERYHTVYNPAPNAQVKARCQQRPKDTPPMVTARMEEYRSFAEELTDYYSDEGAVRINADQDPQTVFEYIESILVKPLPKLLGKD